MKNGYHFNDNVNVNNKNTENAGDDEDNIHLDNKDDFVLDDNDEGDDGVFC